MKGDPKDPAYESAILAELRRRELLFHQPDSGTGRAELADATDEGFWEVGASGRIYDRAYVLDELERRAGLPREEWPATDFACRKIAGDSYLLTYTLAQGSRITRRATIWQRTGSGWKIMYHQGTVVVEPNV